MDPSPWISCDIPYLVSSHCFCLTTFSTELPYQVSLFPCFPSAALLRGYERQLIFPCYFCCLPRFSKASGKLRPLPRTTIFHFEITASFQPRPSSVLHIPTLPQFLLPPFNILAYRDSRETELFSFRVAPVSFARVRVQRTSHCRGASQVVAALLHERYFCSTLRTYFSISGNRCYRCTRDIVIPVFLIFYAVAPILLR